MFNGSFLRVCRILQFVKKIRFCLLESGRTKPWSRVWCLGRVPKHRNQWQEVEGLLFNLKNYQLVHILSFPSYLRSCMNLRIVQKNRFSLHESGWIKAWCPGLVSRPSAKAQEPFELLFLGCGFLIHLSNRSDSPLFRAAWKRYVKNTGHNRNRLYSTAIHCPASMEMHYVQWFLLMSVYEITDCAKNQIFTS